MPTIVTVDDYGYSHASNALVEQAITQHVLTHVSVMTNMPGSEAALRFAKEIRSGGPQFGIHVNLTEGKPLLPAHAVKTLVDGQGRFLGLSRLVRRLVLRQVHAADIEREVNAQCDRMAQARIPISFLNSHQHIHLWPEVARAIQPLLKQNDIAFVRSPRVIWWPSVRLRHGIKALLIQRMGQLSGRRFTPVSDQLVDLDWAARSQGAWSQLLQSVPEGAEIACHPHDETTMHSDEESARKSTLFWLLGRRQLLTNLPHH